MVSLRKIAWISFLAFAIAQSACVDSDHPLVEPEKAEFDKRVIGKWQSIHDDLLEFALAPKEVKNAPPGLVELRGNSGEQPSYQYVFFTKVGQNHYMHLIVFKIDAAKKVQEWKKLKEWNKADVVSYWIMRY